MNIIFIKNYNYLCFKKAPKMIYCRKFSKRIHGKKIICLNILDFYSYMAEKLIKKIQLNKKLFIYIFCSIKR